MTSDGAVLSLQRGLGNRAVCQLLRARVGTAGPTPSPRLLQRNDESKKVMEYLATPQTFELQGKEITVQDDLAAALDKAIPADVIAIDQEQKKLDEKRKKLRKKIGKLEEKSRTASPKEKQKPGDQYTKLDPRGTKLDALKQDMRALEKESQRLIGTRRSYDDATFIGAIILKDKVGTLEDLVASAQLVDLPRANDPDATVKQSLVGGAYHLVKSAKLAPLVISNTLVTMERAQQLDYLRKAGLPNSKFVILVEVHYYRNRPAGSTKLHKDTRGETLFVNLSFTNKRKILGPEYVVNPASHAIYDQFVKQNLPEVFVDDLEALRRDFKGKRIIAATVLEANGVVAFVDEAIHHKTPTAGPRTASATGLRQALAYIYQDEYTETAKVFERYNAASISASGGDGPPVAPPRWTSILTNPAARANPKAWLELHQKLDILDGKELNRAELKKWLPDYFTGRADEILEQAATDFTSVSYSHLGLEDTLTVPVRQREDAPLERTMSLTDLSQYKVTPTEGGKRSFFRTWVRAVPRANFG